MTGAFSHEALLYAGESEFLAGTIGFIREGLAAGEPALVVVSAARIGRIRAALGGGVPGVCFADMAKVGTNPARIIPAWREFVAAQPPGRPFRGIGEPIGRERSPAELVECQRHESLLNVAFAGGPGWRLLCPYDVEALDAAVIEEAERSHPVVRCGDAERASATYRGLDGSGAPFTAPLPEPPCSAPPLQFDGASLEAVRERVSREAVGAGLGPTRATYAVLAVNEVATNSVRHGGGRGTIRVWRDAGGLVCEVRDAGRIEQPLVGRELPAPSRAGGRGLWLVNQLCDLVQLRSFPSGTVVRLHVRR